MTKAPEAARRRGAGSPEGTFVVRPGRPGDAGSFMDLWRTVVAERRFVRTDTVGGSTWSYRRRYFRRTWTLGEVSLVAVAGDRVIGHLTASRDEGPVTRHVATLGMAVAPDWRGRGVGSALLTESIRWARAMGVEKLALSVYPDNEAALALYGKFGFRQEGRLTGHSKKSIGYVDEIVMGLWLVDRPEGASDG
jgi:ribosomal protein S18 acetylase RimI-like enzyme